MLEQLLKVLSAGALLFVVEGLALVSHGEYGLVNTACSNSVELPVLVGVMLLKSH